MARKNGNGEGSRPRERADGRWEARYWVDGKRRSVYGGTRKEAADKLAKALANIDEPPAFKPANITLGEFFEQYEDVARDTMKRRSYETYRDIARLHLLPEFGTMKLLALSREHVQRMYARKRDAGLSAARVRHTWRAVVCTQHGCKVAADSAQRMQGGLTAESTAARDTSVQSGRNKAVHSSSRR